jgi:hypothetical protein
LPVENSKIPTPIGQVRLGYSRRVFVRAFRHDRQSAWFDGIEAAFRPFGGVPREVLFDNARALVDHHDAATREVSFNERLAAFARYWDFRPRACAPYRARTKGKTSAVSVTSETAIAGRPFISLHFESCSDFTYVTARRIAQPPKAAFVARLRPDRSPRQAACQLPDQTDYYLDGTLLDW